MELVEHVVRFDEWCKKCKHYKVDETKDPCDECLCHPINLNTTKPQRFESK